VQGIGRGKGRKFRTNLPRQGRADRELPPKVCVGKELSIPPPVPDFSGGADSW
jgi:hypothetical protein